MRTRRIFAVGLLVLCACRAPQAGPELFAQAETLYLDGKREEAQAPLRKYLLAHPNHAGAHFYLGSIYTLGDDFRPAVAEGELQLALQLYIDGGRKSPIDRFPDEYFETRCNVESAKVMMKLIIQLADNGVPFGSMKEFVKRMRMYLERARRVQPEFEDVVDLEVIVKDFEQLAGIQYPPVETTPPSGIDSN